MFDPWVRKIPWRREWQPAPVSLSTESPGERNLMGYSPWGCKELDTTVQLTLLFDVQATACVVEEKLRKCLKRRTLSLGSLSGVGTVSSCRGSSWALRASALLDCRPRKNSASWACRLKFPLFSILRLMCCPEQDRTSRTRKSPP